MNYRDVEIEAFGLEKTRGENRERLWTFKVRLSNSDEGAMSADDAVTVQFDHRPLAKKLAQLDSRSLTKEALVAFGRELANYLLPDDEPNGRSSVRSLFEDNRKAAVRADEGVRLRLKLGYELAKIPWEFIYLPAPGGGDGADGFLALDGRVSIVRHESLDSARLDPAPAGTIKLVAAFASPEGADPLDLVQEQKNLEDALSENGALSADVLQDAAFSDLESALVKKDVGIFHFGGHGDIQEAMGAKPGEIIATSTLGFDDGWIPAEQLAINLRKKGVRLAMIGACNSGTRSGKNPWAGIATMLVKTGVPAVVANQYKILDKTAVAFSKLFYQAIAAGLSIEEAVSAGRLAAYNADTGGRDWGIQVMYLRSPHSQILFEGTEDKAVKKAFEQAVQNVVNIDSGGGNVFTGNISIGGSFVGGNQTVINNRSVPGQARSDQTPDRAGRAGEASGAENEEINNVMAQLRVDVMGVVSAGNRSAAGAKLSELEDELQKSGGGNDADIGTLISDLVGLAPDAGDVIKRAFAADVLRSVASGTIVRFVLDDI